ncbi:hypothetical protein H8K38_06215 [Undibacterium sp. FT79W]|uniref:hypothetical protein n=1 Tax=Undibacterium sp. FT79W TaxID=2762296 RepID=UPI00164C09E5|nr:hypothetical protein [Undibacterium sp. FT79W]MBC3877394.1 hypothetical protein [Undibacterium sp. FT79W]
MAIQFKQKFKRVNKAIRLKESLLAGNDTLIAWWYSGFYKNRMDSSQPHVLVIFRRLVAGIVSDEVIPRRIPLTALGQVRIGSVWKGDVCQAETQWTKDRFQVDFTAGAWRFTSLEHARRMRQAPPFEPETFKLQYENDQNWLIEFDLANGGKLLIPCVEFFSRCYGRSGEVKRILATYRWQGQADSVMERLYAPLDTPDEPGKWQVRLRKRLVKGDVVFLAHTKYDPYTQREAKGIYAQIEAMHDPQQKYPAFIKVAPWFEGPAELSVAGIPFDNGKSFLALQVVGMSDPQGLLILRSRENSRDAEKPAPEGSPEAWAGVPDRVLVKYPDIVDLTGDLEPDHEAGAMEIQDPDFEILGESRAVIDVRAEQATTVAGPKSDTPMPSTVSGGETHSSGKGVGYASIHARPVFESHGMVRDMWEAMLRLQTTRPDLIQALSWFTFKDGFSSDPTPGMIALEPFDEDADATATARRFPYLDPTIPSLRGVLVARLTQSDGPTYIMEIMRRPKKITADDGELKDAEESFQGLIFRLTHENQLIPWLREILSRIRHENGVFKRLTGSCPGIADSFSHRLSSNLASDCLPCEPIVLGAIAKLKGRTSPADLGA